MTLNIDKEYLGELGFDYEKIAKEVVEAALDFEKCPYEAEVSLVLTTDEEIRKTNAEFRKIDRVTDVLSFPMLDFDTPGDFSFLEEEEDAFHPDHRRIDFRRYYDCSRKNERTGRNLWTWGSKRVCFLNCTQYAASNGI